MSKKDRNIILIVLGVAIATLIMSISTIVVVKSSVKNEHLAETTEKENIKEIKDDNFVNEQWKTLTDSLTRFSVVEKFTIDGEVHYILRDTYSNVLYITNGKFFTPLVDQKGDPMLSDPYGG